MKDAQRFRVKATLENISLAIDYVAELAQTAGFGEPVLCQIRLGVDEACANVVEHAYGGMECGDMEVSCNLDGQDFVICVRDWGRGFDQDSIAEPDVTAPLEERKLGGLGLFLIRKIMDRVEYRSDPIRGNECTMVKRLEMGS